MTSQLPFIANQPAARDHGEADSVFRSAGQTKQYPPRPHITTAKPQAAGPTKAAAKPRGGKTK